MGTRVDQKKLDYEHMGTRVDQNIQTKGVHVLIRTFRLRTHGYTC